MNSMKHSKYTLNMVMLVKNRNLVNFCSVFHKTGEIVVIIRIS